MSTEFGDEKTCFSPSAASAGRFPRIPGHLGCRPSLSPAWRISPGCPWIDNFRGFGIRFDNTFLLLLHGLFVSFAFCFRVHVSISTSTVFSAGLQEQSVQEELTPISVLAHSFSPFVSHFDTHFCNSVTAPCSAGEHKATVHICMQKPRAQSSRLGLPLRSLCRVCDSSTESPAWCSSSQTTELHPSSVFQLYFVAPWHAASSSHAADRQAYAYVPGSNKPRASKPGWPNREDKKKKKAHLAAMSKKASACFAKSSGHVFNHPRREIELKESVLGSDWTWKLVMASLATTVDNTIKMADTVRKHGCQWCIRSIPSIIFGKVTAWYSGR